jgi:hypothetical protein
MVKLSKHQTDVVNFVDTGTGSAVVIAVAGSGKTFTIEQSLYVIPQDKHVQLFAFNASIAKELNVRLDRLREKTGKAYPNMRASTFHSIGMGAVARHLGKKTSQLNPDGKKVSRITNDWLDGKRHKTTDEALTSMYASFCSQLVDHAKGQGIGALVPDTDDVWYDIIRHHDMFLDSETATEEEAIYIARKLLQRSNELSLQGEIDFNDMLYLPILWKLRLWQNDFVFVDEAQDTNPVRRAMIKMALKPKGRMIAVGDPRQAVYGFCHPPGTKILTPEGYKNIETIKKGDKFIAANSRGDLAGWGGDYEILETTVHRGWSWILELEVSGHRVRMTPHHRVPVKINHTAMPFITYMMRRGGKFRVGYMSLYANAGKNEKRFMLSQRCKMESADAAWIIATHQNRFDAIIHEASLHARGACGVSFSYLTDKEVKALPQSSSFYEKLLSEHNRHIDFPLWVAGRRQHFEKNMPFITEACNIVPGMKVQVLGEFDKRNGRRGRSRHLGKYESATVTKLSYSAKLPTYGITVKAMPTRDGYNEWPLYVADGVVVHNTGATDQAIEVIKHDFHAIELPLTVSYRCPPAIVRFAQELVSHIEANPDATIEGKFEQVPLWQALQNLDSHDAILCRNTAPLITLAFGLIGRGRACVVLGREIGQGLISIIKKLKAVDIDALVPKLEAHRLKEYIKFMARNEENKAEAICDRVDCISTFIDNLTEDNYTIAGLVGRIEAMFSDTNGALTLSTVHKSKGREWRRVAVLHPELMPSKFARQDWQKRQETNVEYVARTRAMEELYYCTNDQIDGPKQ